jgi:hypothetical protein
VDAYFKNTAFRENKPPNYDFNLLSDNILRLFQCRLPALRFLAYEAPGRALTISCLRHGKDPAAYLRDVLSRLPAMTNQDDLDALTPRRWQPLVSSAS